MFVHSQIFALVFVLSSIQNGNLEFTVIRIFATRIPVPSYNFISVFYNDDLSWLCYGAFAHSGGGEIFHFLCGG